MLQLVFAMTSKFFLVVLQVLPVTLLSVIAPKAAAETVMFDNVNVVSMAIPDVLSDRDVLIVDGKIVRIDESIDAPDGATVVDGENRYLMPGLAEMHAHIPPTTQRDNVERVLALYLANGITTVRGMLGEPGHLKLREAQNRGEVVGPRIYTSSPSLNGNSVKSAEDGRAKVNDYFDAGYDLLKIHPGLSQEEYSAISNEARSLGMDFAGHVPAAVGAWRVIGAGQTSVDHLDGFVEALASPEVLQQVPASFFNYLVAPHARQSQIPILLAALKAKKVWVVPTESLMHQFSGTRPLEKLKNDPNLQYVPPATRRSWQQTLSQAFADPNYSRSAAQSFLRLRLQLIKAIHEEGHGVLLGSDAPQVFQVPGFSIHDELVLYERAGLSPFEALATGTINVAQYFGVENSRGQVAEGFDADLVLVAANPLEWVGNAAKVQGVMVAGRWHNQQWRSGTLEEIAAGF